MQRNTKNEIKSKKKNDGFWIKEHATYEKTTERKNDVSAEGVEEKL